MGNISIKIPIKKLLKYLIIFIAFLFIFGLIYNYFYIQGFSDLEHLFKIFYLDGENNIPTWFNSILFLVIFFLLYIIFCFKKSKKDYFTNKWLFLSIIFVLLSLDEVSSVHEMIGYYLTIIIKSTGFLYFSWVIIGSIFLIFLSFYLYKFIFSLPKKTLKIFIISAFIFTLGCIFMELLGSNQFYLHGPKNWTYAVFSVTEEILEMLGLTIFIYGLLSYIKENKILTNILVD